MVAMIGVESTAIRVQNLFKPWFDLADDLNRLGCDMLNGHETPLQDNQRLLITALFARAHKSLQAALILAERGLIGDANAVLRSAVEGAIALNALAADASFVDKLIGAHRLNQRKLANVVLNCSDYRASYAPEKIAEMEAIVNEVKALNSNPETKVSEINWYDVAKTHCNDLYQLLYRLLSTNGTHTNIDAIQQQFEVDSAGRITALKVGPDTAGLIDTLQSACLAFLWAAEPFARTFPKNGIAERIQAQIRRFSEINA